VKLKKITISDHANATEIRIAALKAQHEKEKANLNKKLGECEYKIRLLARSHKAKDKQLKVAEARIQQLQQDLELSEGILVNNGIICKISGESEVPVISNSNHDLDDANSLDDMDEHLVWNSSFESNMEFCKNPE
jgi:septal ring factor EnvC (AmiA/AmiB activator)